MSDRGVVIFHDMNWVSDGYGFGAWRFRKETREGRPSCPSSAGRGLGMPGVGPSIPGPADFLFSADAETALRIRTASGNRGLSTRNLHVAKRRLPSLLPSRSWRITAPLRAVMDLLLRQ
jgi:hypothetical protein